MAASNPSYFLGLDLSTQRLKAIVVECRNDKEALFQEPFCSQHGCACVGQERSLSVAALVHEDSVLLDNLGFGTSAGAHVSGQRATAPVAMWITALDVLLERLKSAIKVSRIRAIGGCGQQHGTVYWRDVETLRNCDPSRSFAENLECAFSFPDCPIWMDSSTSVECCYLEEAVGGRLNLAKITGSRAFERFSGPQIRKLASDYPDKYAETKRISLVSSFIASLLIGDIAPMDVADASGMNLMDINTYTWSNSCLRGCVANQPPNCDSMNHKMELDVKVAELRCKLGDDKNLVLPGADIGPVSSFVQKRFGFDSNCRVIAFTGDNPSTLIGLGAGCGDMVLSLGSSDTLLLTIDNKDAPILLDGHLMASPIDKKLLMAMLCFKNGSLTRDRVVLECAQGNWSLFDKLLESTPPGNNGKVGFYFDFEEILPKRRGRFRFDISGSNALVITKPFLPAVEARALIEGQLMAKFVYARKIGFNGNLVAGMASTSNGRVGAGRVLVAGGGSNSAQVCQIVADVFNLPVHAAPVGPSRSAAMGGAYMAAKSQAHQLRLPPAPLVAAPRHPDVYQRLCCRFEHCLQLLDLP